MQFSSFAEVLKSIEATTLRNQMTRELAELFKRLDKDEIEPACWLMLGRINPQYEGTEFQFAEKMMVRAVAAAYDKEITEIAKAYKKSGDLGATTGELAGTKVGKQTIKTVFEKLKALASEAGGGSQERKLNTMVELLKSLDPLSVKYVVRITLGKLRLGFSDMTILDALSWAIKGDKSDRKALEEAYQNRHDIGKLATAYLEGKAEALKHVEIELGIPIQPALCQRLKSPQEMITKMGKVFAESKYDGIRVQIHIAQRAQWKVRTFTRSLEESSAQFPELVQAVAAFGNHDLILDCETVGFDPKSGKLLPFQETVQRKRKYGIEELSKTVPLRFFVFDLLYKDGKSLLNVPLHERKEMLHVLFGETKDHELGHLFIESDFIVTDSSNELRDFHKKQLDAGLEGAVVKQYNGAYQPGRRGFSWVKFKEEESQTGKLSDTIDAVVMGYWYGKGKRTSFGIGAFLIGVAGEGGKILTVTKVGTGLSDEQWRELKERCTKNVATEKPKEYEVADALEPDVWVDPKIVVEVAGDELTNSPNHTAGLALRFPRLVKFRDDKSISEITTKKELTSIK